MLSDFSFQETDWEVGFDFKFNNSNNGFGIAPTGRSTPYHHIMWGSSLSNISFYIGKASGGETAYRFGSPTTNTYYSVRIVKDGNTLSLYVNDVLQGSYTALDYMSSDTFGFYWLEWQSGNTIYAKNIYAKAL